MTYIVSALYFFCLGLHPLHVSVTEIEYDRQSKSMKIIMRIFIDDLESEIRIERKSGDLNIMAPPAGISTDALLRDYIARHFAIFLDNKKQRIRYVGHEPEDEALLCYLEIPNIRKWSEIKVMNTAIQSVYDDQSNLVHVTVGDEIKSLRLVKDKPSGALIFEIK